jgi:23S rRNA (uracil1939-C5)-methyltransferase
MADNVLKKNDEVVLKIISLGMNGEGIARHGGFVVFAKNALAGEEVLAKIILVKKSFAVAKVLKILKRSDDRTEPLCPVFLKCGGCALQHLSYKKQGAFKADLLYQTLNKVSDIDFKPEKCVLSDFSYGYRNKCQVPVRAAGDKALLGFYRENSNEVVSINDCPLHPQWFKALLESTKEFVEKHKIPCYDAEKKRGLLKHLVAKSYGSEVMVMLVINGKSLKNHEAFIEILNGKLAPRYKFSLYLNINTAHNNAVLSDNFVHLYGGEYIETDALSLKNIRLHPASFMQVNNNIRDKIYNKVLELTDEASVVVDAFSGAGVLSCLLAKKAKRVYAIEIVKAAHDDAVILSKANGLSEKTTYINQDCAPALPKLLSELNNSAPSLDKENITLVLDPPRKGCGERIITEILKNPPQKIIYISCSPVSLAKDLKLLLTAYEISALIPFDMFPQTPHVETVISLELKKLLKNE